MTQEYLNKPLTLGDFRREFKKEFKKEFNPPFTRLIHQIDTRFIAMENRIDSLEVKWDKRMETFDALALELREAREERVLGGEQRIRMDDTLKDHEKRLQTLESKS